MSTRKCIVAVILAALCGQQAAARTVVRAPSRVALPSYAQPAALAVNPASMLPAPSISAGQGLTLRLAPLTVAPAAGLPSLLRANEGPLAPLLNVEPSLLRATEGPLPPLKALSAPAAAKGAASSYAPMAATAGKILPALTAVAAPIRNFLRSGNQRGMADTLNAVYSGERGASADIAPFDGGVRVAVENPDAPTLESASRIIPARQESPIRAFPDFATLKPQSISERSDGRRIVMQALWGRDLKAELVLKMPSGHGRFSMSLLIKHGEEWKPLLKDYLLTRESERDGIRAAIETHLTENPQDSSADLYRYFSRILSKKERNPVPTKKVAKLRPKRVVKIPFTQEPDEVSRVTPKRVKNGTKLYWEQPQRGQTAFSPDGTELVLAPAKEPGMLRVLNIKGKTVHVLRQQAAPSDAAAGFIAHTGRYAVVQKIPAGKTQPWIEVWDMKEQVVRKVRLPKGYSAPELVGNGAWDKIILTVGVGRQRRLVVFNPKDNSWEEVADDKLRGGEEYFTSHPAPVVSPGGRVVLFNWSTIVNNPKVLFGYYKRALSLVSNWTDSWRLRDPSAHSRDAMDLGTLGDPTVRAISPDGYKAAVYDPQEGLMRLEGVDGGPEIARISLPGLGGDHSLHNPTLAHVTFGSGYDERIYIYSTNGVLYVWNPRDDSLKSFRIPEIPSSAIFNSASEARWKAAAWEEGVLAVIEPTRRAMKGSAQPTRQARAGGAR